MTDKAEELIKLANETTLETLDAAMDYIADLPAWYQILFMRTLVKRDNYKLVFLHQQRVDDWCQEFAPIMAELIKHEKEP